MLEFLNGQAKAGAAPAATAPLPATSV